MLALNVRAWRGRISPHPTPKGSKPMRKTIAAVAAATLAGGALALAAPLAASATQYSGDKCLETHVTYNVESYVQTAPATPDTLEPRYDYSDSRATGHFEAIEDGLHIWTEGATSTDKVALYRTVNVPLASVTSASVDYTATTGITPGSQVVVDIDSDGVGDGILVTEPVYGDVAWLSNNATADFKAGAPHVGGGYGSENYGTLSEWGTAFPDATVVAVGFSLGSGVLGDGVVHAVNVGGVAYSFTQVVAGSPATYGWVKTGSGHALTLPADTDSTRYIAAGTKKVKVACAPEPEPIVTVTEDSTTDCEAGTVTTTTTTTTIGWTLNRYTNTWTEKEPVEEVASSERAATAEECPVVTPTPTPTDTPTTVVPASHDGGGLAETGGDTTTLPLTLGAAAVALAAGAVLMGLHVRRRRINAQR